MTQITFHPLQVQLIMTELWGQNVIDVTDQNVHPLHSYLAFRLSVCLSSAAMNGLIHPQPLPAASTKQRNTTKGGRKSFEV